MPSKYTTETVWGVTIIYGFINGGRGWRFWTDILWYTMYPDSLFGLFGWSSLVIKNKWVVAVDFLKTFASITVYCPRNDIMAKDGELILIHLYIPLINVRFLLIYTTVHWRYALAHNFNRVQRTIYRTFELENLPAPCPYKVTNRVGMLYSVVMGFFGSVFFFCCCFL